MNFFVLARTNCRFSIYSEFAINPVLAHLARSPLLLNVTMSLISTRPKTRADRYTTDFRGESGSPTEALARGHDWRRLALNSQFLRYSYWLAVASFHLGLGMRRRRCSGNQCIDTARHRVRHRSQNRMGRDWRATAREA